MYAMQCNLQRAFRGWRTRRRVVLQVREDMELLVADIRRQLDGEWALLGPTATATAFSLDWGNDTRLRLPRMEDAIFGVPVRFPEELGRIVDDEPGPESQHDATDGGSSTGKAGIASAGAERVVGAQVSQGTDAAEKTAGPAHETSRCDAHASAVEIRSTALQAETSATDSTERQVENMAGQPGKDGDSQLASVQAILATHSRADILLELQWARQALRDRRKVRVGRLLPTTSHPGDVSTMRVPCGVRGLTSLCPVTFFPQYLRSKQRVERGPDPCACA
jgi:hypothetical protein